MEPSRGLSIEMKTSHQSGKRKSTGLEVEPVSVYTVSSAALIAEDAEAGAAQDTPYDPYDNRQLSHPTNNFETWVHMLKGSLGTGILAMPDAFNNAGLLVGLVFTVIIGSLCTYCLHVLIRCQYTLCQRARLPVLNYPDSMRLALQSGPVWLRRAAPYSPVIVDVFLVVYQLGICCVYIVFVGSNIKQVLDNWYPSVRLEVYMLAILVPLILLNWVRDLKRLAPFSSVANTLTLVGFGIILYYVFDEMPDISARPLSQSFKTFPLFIGTVLFALEAVGLVIALENNMKTPRSFPGYCGVLNMSMGVIVFLYAFLGFFGYARYGDKIKGSITLNLTQTAIPAQVCKLMFSFAVFITYALQCYVPFDIMWEQRLKRKMEKTKYPLLWEYAFRTAVVCGTFVLAVAVPRLELFISLFGALCLSALGLVFPALIEICVLWPNMGRYNWILYKDLVIFTVGLLALVIGTYVALQDIILSLF